MRLSVVIPTRNRRATLEGTLQSLRRQRVDPHEPELIVVDNGSDDGTSETVRAQAESFPWPLCLIEWPHAGASGARNAGIAAARHELILFIGDDTRPVGDSFLRDHGDLHEQRTEERYAVLGNVEWDPCCGVTPLMRWLEKGRQFDYGSIWAGEVAPHTHFYTANLSVKRRLLEDAGGFDERLPFLFEDTELGARLAERGLVLDYHPELVVLHHHAITLERWLSRQRVAGRSARKLNEIQPRHPPLAAHPDTFTWKGVRLVGSILMRIPGEWRWLPRPPREHVYRILDSAAYAQGYGERWGCTDGGP